jgi:hypothetical protein
MAQQAELAAACGETVEESETSQSDWSEDQVSITHHCNKRFRKA